MLYFRRSTSGWYAIAVVAAVFGCADSDVGTVNAERETPAGQARNLTDAAGKKSSSFSRSAKRQDLSPRSKERVPQP